MVPRGGGFSRAIKGPALSELFALYSMHKTVFLWIFLLGLCLTATTALQAQATLPGRIVLARVTPDVTVTNKATGETKAAANAMEIAQNYTVTTGKTGSVVLVFSNGSTINLKQDSVLDIEQYLQDPFDTPFNPATATAEPTVSNTKLNLTRGELVGNVKKLDKARNSSFSVQTPVGAAGIRGTTFRIVYRPSGTGTAFFSLTTTEGNVTLEATGAVAIPVASNPEQGETPKEVVIEVQVNDVTGVVTITTPTGGTVVIDAPAASVAAVTTSVTEVVQAVANIVFAAPTPAEIAAAKAAAEKEAADKKAAEEKAAAEKKAADDKAAADKAAADKAAADKAAADKAAAEKKAAEEKAAAEASPPPVVPPTTTTSGAGGSD